MLGDTLVVCNDKNTIQQKVRLYTDLDAVG